jgi:hypothetical protein
MFLCQLKGKCINAALNLLEKINTKPSVLVSQKCILKTEGLKTHQSLPVFATFCLFLPVWCGFGSATMLTSEKHHYELVSKMSAKIAGENLNTPWTKKKIITFAIKTHFSSYYIFV